MADTADYRRLPAAIRDARRIAAHSAATLAREHYADLLVAEAGIAACAVHPDLARLVFQLGQDAVGSSVTLIAAYALDGHQLWHIDDGQEWPDESLVTDPSPLPPTPVTATCPRRRTPTGCSTSISALPSIDRIRQTATTTRRGGNR